MNELMTAPELAKYLKVELRTVYRYLKDAQLPAIRMEGCWRFRREDIDQWLLRHTQLQASKESAIEAVRLGVTDYFEKPIRDLAELASTVERALKP